MIFTQEHNEIRRTVKNFVDKEINPHVDEWEKAGSFPMKEIFKKLGDLGLLGISKPEEYGGMGLDYSYNIVRDPVHVHDLNATILHQLGIDHERLTFKFQGRQYRLTDVHGRVVREILA